MDNFFSLTLKEWADEDKPREKMLSKGKKELTNAELIAILLRSGLPGKSVVEVAKETLTLADNSLTALSKMEFKQLSSIKGLGTAKAATLMAALELGWRMQGEISSNKLMVVTAGFIVGVRGSSGSNLTAYAIQDGDSLNGCTRIYAEEHVVNRTFRSRSGTIGGVVDLSTFRSGNINLNVLIGVYIDCDGRLSNSTGLATTLLGTGVVVGATALVVGLTTVGSTVGRTGVAAGRSSLLGTVGRPLHLGVNNTIKFPHCCN